MEKIIMMMDRETEMSTTTIIILRMVVVGKKAAIVGDVNYNGAPVKQLDIKLGKSLNMKIEKKVHKINTKPKRAIFLNYQRFKEKSQTDLKKAQQI